MRIGKFLSHAGVCSRREAADFLLQHEVLLEGEKITRPDTRVSEKASLIINGEEIGLSAQKEVVLLNKPAGYVCSHREQKNKKSIFRLLPHSMQKYYFAGRLDEDSRGLVVLSNDGDFIYRLSHPSQNTHKLYRLQTNRPLSPDEQKRAMQGVFDRGEKLYLHKITPLKKITRYEIELTRGKNREIRRVIERLGARVADLQRVEMGKYKLKEEGDRTGIQIKEGEFKTLPQDNIKGRSKP